ncbi:MAG TPA: ATP-binding protein [Prolixibacteraceae bacterium]|jgi:serine/threonine-protein kinase RsbW|nr:ATP-binding protein [Prolixibacteraceae bacterium]HRV87965.1 ATP-binding protein [Prolixibacteraceae bacterium]
MPKNKKSVIITSDTAELQLVEHFLTEVFESYQIDPEMFGKVLVCLNEAVINSIMHGNKYDGEKMVRIECYTCNKYLYFRVIDEGEGFNFDDLPDPTCMKNLKKESGRGIFIIRNFSDGIFFRDKGNIVEFKIERSGQN